MLRDQLVFGKGTPGVVIHIGAGGCEELDDYLQAGFKSIVLVEPDAENLAEIRPRLEVLENLEILPFAVAAENGRAPLYRLNFPPLSSLRRPVGLKSLLPGVEISDEYQVDTASFETIVEKAGALSGPDNNLLVIDAPGEEQAIAEALVNSPHSKAFQSLVLRCGLEPYYEGGSCVKTVLPVLAQAGYRLEATDQDGDPDWPVYFLRLDRVQLENKALSADLEKLKAQIARLKDDFKQEKTNLRTQAGKVQSDLERQVSERVQELQKLRNDLKQAELELKRNQADSARARKILETRLAHREQEWKSAETRLEEQAKAMAAQRVELEKLQTAQASDAASRKELQDKLTARDAELQKQTKAMAAQRVELEKLQTAQASDAASRKELQDKLTARNRESQAQAETLAKQQALLDKLQVGKVTADASRKELQDKLAARNAELQKQVEIVAAQRAELDKLHAAQASGEASRKELQSKLDARNAEILKLRDQLEVAKTRAKELEDTYAAKFRSQEEGLKQDLRVALRLQAMARNDQQDLQERYRLLQSEKDQQEELLIKVTQKLGSAAKHLHRLAHPETVPAATISVPLENPPPAEVKPAKKTRRKKKKKKKSKTR